MRQKYVIGERRYSVPTLHLVGEEVKEIMVGANTIRDFMNTAQNLREATEPRTILEPTEYYGSRFGNSKAARIAESCERAEMRNRDLGENMNECHQGGASIPMDTEDQENTGDDMGSITGQDTVSPKPKRKRQTINEATAVGTNGYPQATFNRFLTTYGYYRAQNNNVWN
jgi:hypothetical protein